MANIERLKTRITLNLTDVKVIEDANLKPSNDFKDVAVYYNGYISCLYIESIITDDEYIELQTHLHNEIKRLEKKFEIKDLNDVLDDIKDKGNLNFHSDKARGKSRVASEIFKEAKENTAKPQKHNKHKTHKYLSRQEKVYLYRDFLDMSNIPIPNIEKYKKLAKQYGVGLTTVRSIVLSKPTFIQKK